MSLTTHEFQEVMLMHPKPCATSICVQIRWPVFTSLITVLARGMLGRINLSSAMANVFAFLKAASSPVKPPVR